MTDRATASAPRMADPESHATADLHWYAIWTRSRHEQVVRDQLSRKQVEEFLPTITQ